MKREKITSKLIINHKSFVDYLSTLTEEEFEFSHDQKWTAGQQLEHIVLCMRQILQAYSMDKKVLEQTFGRTERQGLSYETLLNIYLEKFASGGKSPERFHPKNVVTKERDMLSVSLMKIVSELCIKIEDLSDQDLNSLQIPHPLLGNLTLQEMLYNAIYHVEHHQKSTVRNLMNK
ncbi:DinB family protein [Flavobacterium soyangense]|uniref:DinB family protein n=1 Tax=Flavobacterium soyangense TaxID=2023265 RepID=A0A930UAH6_9FLAO|nr:DinB family protein [Flavobacterium soyangense]MBF2707874.1 DinB family protein [Flavobacterium soyangense]